MRPKFFREKTDDLGTLSEVFDGKVYDPKWFSLEKNSIKTIIDVGGLIGSFTLWAQQSFPNASIFTYEPDPDSFEILCKNIDLVDSKKERIHPFNYAVWSENSTMKLYRSKVDTAESSIIFDHSLFENQPKEESIDVKTKSISEIIDSISKPIDIIKLDCEGAEYEILYSLDESKLSSIRHIVMEVHFTNNEDSKVKDLVKYLRKNGFIVQMSQGMYRIGFIYAKRFENSKNNLNLINNLIDDTINIANERYSGIRNRKSVKLALKISRFAERVKSKLK